MAKAYGIDIPEQFRKDAECRLLNLLERTSDGCWVYTGSQFRGNYGRFTIPTRGPVPAHRASYALFCAPIPADILVCHRCDNRRCCNPAHLFLGTSQDNVSDCVAKGRHARGERSAHAKLTDATVIAIRKRVAAGERPLDMVNELGVVHAAIVRAVNGTGWKHLDAVAPPVRTGQRGERSGLAKLKTADVIRIREMLAQKVRQRLIAEQFGVTQTCISQIAVRKSWAHLK